MEPSSDFDLTVLHHIEFDAGLSNHVVPPQLCIPVMKSLIEQSETRVVELATLLEEERSHLERMKTAIAPWKKLPYELLCRIIKQSSKSFSLHSKNWHQNAPWFCRQVCSTWRQAAISCKEYWNHLNFDRYSQRSDPPLDFWVQNLRHPSYPISISHLQGETLLDVVYEKIIVPYHQSIISLATVADAFLLLPSVSFPLLKDLKLTWHTTRVGLNNTSCFLGMHNLRTLSLYGCAPSTKVTVIPMNQLTSLILSDGVDLSVIIEVLRRCHNTLIHLAIRVRINPKTFMDYEKPHFILPHLESFKFTESIYGRSSTLQHKNTSLLQYVTLPNLKTLSLDLHCTEKDIDFPAMPFLSLFERSQCPLRELHISSSQLTIEPCSEFSLDNLPSLTLLDAKWVLFSQSTILQIAAGRAIPNINILKCAVVGTSAVQHLTELIERRTENGDPMGQVSLRVVIDSQAEQYFADNVQDYLDRARSCGGQLDVLSYTPLDKI